MTPDRANAVYDILRDHAGAAEINRDDFVACLTVYDPDCREYRFQGSLGFGGKYRPRTNTVDCYREDETPERLETIRRVNALLKAL